MKVATEERESERAREGYDSLTFRAYRPGLSLSGVGRVVCHRFPRSFWETVYEIYHLLQGREQNQERKKESRPTVVENVTSEIDDVC